MTQIWYDCEFLENGITIELISIGMTRSDGAEYYAISSDAPLKKIQQHGWLMDNVVPHLPLALVVPEGRVESQLAWNRLHPNYGQVLSPLRISEEVTEFVTELPKPELWAWYAAYDHVALCQLFGSMTDLPAGIPMWTNDLKTVCQIVGNPSVPKQDEKEAHHALYDARHNMRIHQFLDQHAALGPLSQALTMHISPGKHILPGTDLDVILHGDKSVSLRYLQIEPAPGHDE